MNVQRSLLDAHFEGYKLSLDSIPCYKKEFDSGPLGFKTLSDDQYSYFHTKLFSTTNVLIQDDKIPEPNETYLLNGSKILKLASIVDQIGKVELTEVFNCGETASTVSEESYYSSLSFASNDFAIFGDGKGSLTVLDTSDRNHQNSSDFKWKSIYHFDIGRPFVVLSSTKNGEMINVAIQYIEEKSKVSLKEDVISSAPNYVNVIEWLILSGAEKLELERLRRFVFFGDIEYVELSKDALLYFGEDKAFYLVYDSAGGSLEDEMELEANGKAEEKIPKFFWLQGVEDMAIWVALPEGINKREIKVILKPSHLTVKIRDETIIEGKLWNILDTDSMTWTIDSKKKRLEITVCKANVGMIWQRFLADRDILDGEEVMDPKMIDKIQEQLAHLTTDNPMPEVSGGNNQVYNNEQLEACDKNPDVSRALMLIKSTVKDVQKVSIGDCQFLFKSLAVGLSPQQLCIRHDVDGLVWQPQVLEDGNLTLEHVDTFNALGYVQASKNGRRFVVASPDRLYVSIIDRARHVYIYRKPEPISDGCELRNRKSGQRVSKVAKQQVVTLDHDVDDFVIGAVATNQTLFISTQKALFCLIIH